MAMIGHIALLQVQRSNLKQGDRPRRWFDPAPLLHVPLLEVSASGAFGHADGQRVVDVHNVEHPQSKWRGPNGLSFGFSSHYRRMRERFGEWMPLGVAGENVIVEATQEYRAADLPGALVVVTAGGAVRLGGATPIEPCLEFSRYALGHRGLPGQDLSTPAQAVTDTLAFLRHGTRGYLLTYQDGPTMLRPGDAVYAG